MTVINSFFTIIFFLFMVTMTPYAMDTYNVSIKVAGLAASIFVIGSLIGRVLAGRYITYYGASKVLAVSLILFVIISVGYFFAYNIEILFIIRILQGLVAGMIGTATGTVSMQVVPPAKRAEGIAYYSSSAVIGAAIGPFIGMFLLGKENGFYWIFIINILFGLISWMILKVTKLNIVDLRADLPMKKQPFSLGSMIEIKAVPISFIALVIGFCFSSVTSFLVTYSKEIDLVQTASYYFLVHAFCIVCTRFFTGKWIDVKGANIIIYPCLVLFSFGLLLYSQASTTWMFLGAAALISTGFGNFNSGAQTLAVKFVPPHRLGVATATFFIFMDIGSGLGPYLLGFIIEGIGYEMLYIVVSIIGFMCVPLYYYFYGRKEKTVVQQQESLQVNQN